MNTMKKFTIILESATSEDVIQIYKSSCNCEDEHYAIDFIAERPLGQTSGGKKYHRIENNPSKVVQYMNDIFELIRLDAEPPKMIHILSDGYPLTLIERENFSNARDVIIRMLKAILCI